MKDENMKDKHQRFLQIDTIILGVCGLQAYPNNLTWQVCYLFAISSERNSDEADFLHANKHLSFLQIDTMIFDGVSQAFPKFPK